jgi:hypothetical protein
MNITTGNAITDGKEFRYWFVGKIEKWCRENNMPFDKERFGLRSTDDMEIKGAPTTKAKPGQNGPRPLT